MLENVQQTTLKPLILATIAPGTTVYTDEYDIYARLPEWGDGHKTVCHSRGEYARDEDGDGFHEVHVRLLVIATLLVTSPSGTLTGETSHLLGLFPIRAQRQNPWQRLAETSPQCPSGLAVRNA